MFEDMVREQLFRLGDLQLYYRALDRIYDVNKREAEFYHLLLQKMEAFQEFLKHFAEEHPEVVDDIYNGVEYFKREAIQNTGMYNHWFAHPKVISKHRPSTAVNDEDGKVYVLYYKDNIPIDEAYHCCVYRVGEET